MKFELGGTQLLKDYIKLEHIAILILVTAFIDISPIIVQGSYIRVYQVLFLIMLFFYIIYEIKKVEKIKDIKINFHTPLLMYMGLWVFSYFFAIVNLISIKDFIVVLIGQAFLIVMYYALFNYFIDNSIEKNGKYYEYFIYGAIAIVLIGIIQWIIGMTGIEVGLTHKSALGIARPTSLMRETDWYGMVCMYCTCILIVHLTSEKYFINKKLNVIFLSGSICGLFLSMTRAAMLGVVIAVGVLLFFKEYRKKLLKYFGILFILALVVAGTLCITNLSLAQKYFNRLNPITTMRSDQGASNSRVYAYRLTMDYIKLHPIVGNGVGGLNLLSSDENIRLKYAGGGELNSGRGNANIIMSSLFDTGIIGTVFLIVILYKLLSIIYKFSKKYNDTIAMAFFIGFISLLIDFMFNNGLRFGFMWVAMAIIMARISKIEKEPYI